LIVRGKRQLELVPKRLRTSSNIRSGSRMLKSGSSDSVRRALGNERLTRTSYRTVAQISFKTPRR
jgi:hypothetical protein